MTENRYDLMVVGTGPAGLTAAVYAQRFGMKTAVFGDIPGGNLYMIESLRNIPGFPEGISGTQWGIQAFRQAQQEGAFFPMARLERLEFSGKDFRGTDADGREYAAGAAIVATGRKPRIPAIPGVEKRGIHFCSVCDGPLYRNKEATLAVVGGSGVAGHHALTLSTVAQKVLLIFREDTPAMEAAVLSQVKSRENIELIAGVEVAGLSGPDSVEGIVLSRQGGEPRTIPVNGVFFALGWDPDLDMLKTSVETTAEGYLKTDPRLMTSLSGLFAAGDVRDTDLRQVVTACADGARAAAHAFAYLRMKDEG
jgi:thioredoxin reductase (NADPH)